MVCSFTFFKRFSAVSMIVGFLYSSSACWPALISSNSMKHQHLVLRTAAASLGLLRTAAHFQECLPCLWYSSAMRAVFESKLLHLS